MRLPCYLFLIIMYSFGFCSCKSQGIYKTSVTCIAPIINEQYKTEQFKSTFSFTYLKDAVIYEFPARKINSFNNKLVSDSYNTEYFIFFVGEKIGYQLDSITDKFNKKKSVDSVLIAKAFKYFNLDSTSLLIKNSSIQQLTKSSFVDKTQLTDNSYDSVYFYYDKNINIPNYTFSKRLDSLHNAKLYKVIFLFPETSPYGPQYRTMSFEMEQLKVENLKELYLIYDRFKEHSSN